MSFLSCGVWQWYKKTLRGAEKASPARNRVKGARISGKAGNLTSVGLYVFNYKLIKALNISEYSFTNKFLTVAIFILSKKHLTNIINCRKSYR